MKFDMPTLRFIVCAALKIYPASKEDLLRMLRPIQPRLSAKSLDKTLTKLIHAELILPSESPIVYSLSNKGWIFAATTQKAPRLKRRKKPVFEPLVVLPIQSGAYRTGCFDHKTCPSLMDGKQVAYFAPDSFDYR